MKTHTEDSVEKNTRQSPVYALLRKASFIDFPGRLCRVLFISGCNLRCVFCHNYDLVKPKDTSIEWDRLEQILLKSRENWIDAVCITGGEPTLHPQLKELILWLKELNFKVKLDTNGTVPEVLKELLPVLDYLAMDYKAPLERYSKLTACPTLEVEKISESRKLILDWKGEYEFRTTVVEGLHTEQDMRTLCAELEGARRYVLQGYVPVRGMETGEDLPAVRTSRSLLRQYHSLCKDYFEETILRGE